MVTFSASLRGSSFSAAILVAAEEEISEILSQEILAGKCNDITHKSQNFEKITFRAICFHDSILIQCKNFCITYLRNVQYSGSLRRVLENNNIRLDFLAVAGDLVSGTLLLLQLKSQCQIEEKIKLNLLRVVPSSSSTT